MMKKKQKSMTIIKKDQNKKATRRKRNRNTKEVKKTKPKQQIEKRRWIKRLSPEIKADHKPCFLKNVYFCRTGGMVDHKAKPY